MRNQHKPYQELSCIKKKIILSIWWDHRGVVHFELLPNNLTINSDVYCQQLVKLEEAIKDKRPELANRKGIVFHYDNARPYTYLATKVLELGWEVMSHPPYSPDLAPSDYYLFQNFLNGLSPIIIVVVGSIKWLVW